MEQQLKNMKYWIKTHLLSENMMMKYLLCFSLLYIGHNAGNDVYATNTYYHVNSFRVGLNDTLPEGKVIDSVILRNYVSKRIVDSVDIRKIALYPFNSLQQALKASMSGLFIQETSGEPGTSEQGMLIRGINRPFLSKEDIALAQPAVFVNGIPLMPENTFVYNIQQYDFNPLGSATNLLSGIDLDNIASIHVVKGVAAAAIYGPRAANGAILITTKNAHEGKSEISLNSYFGYVAKDNVTTTNGVDENNFRDIFYQKYATTAEKDAKPAYLTDITNNSYFGPSNWTDLYYQNAPIHTVNGSITGGTSRSNFRFFGANNSSAGNADDTRLNRYNASFFINMLPLKWLTVSSMINASRMDRDRNKNLRDRFAEMQYVPDLTSPLAPNKTMYGKLLNQYGDKSFDNNIINAIQGSFSLNARVNKFDFLSRISFDYSENIRDLFYNSLLLDGNNYVSNYYAYNQRLIIDNILSYKYGLNKKNQFNFMLGHTFTNDMSKYNYGQGYKGPSDYVRINGVNGNSDSDNYLKSLFLIVNRYTDKQKINLSSLFTKVEYAYNNEWFINAVARLDGASNAQPTERWFFSPILNAQWDLQKHIRSVKWLSALKLNASWGRLGLMRSADRYAAGPQYTSEIGWAANPNIPSYNGYGVITRPYTTGWVGYDIPWSYVEETSVGFEAGLLKDKFHARVDFYSKNSNRMLLGMPTIAEYGYNKLFDSGMDVNNKGVEVSLSGIILKAKNNGLSWNFNVNGAYNVNELKALPQGLKQLTIGSQRLVVGKPIDQIWVLQSLGVYKRDIDVPVNPSNFEVMNYKGLALHAGDPRWKDQNNDYVIDENDKVALGNFIPKFTGNISTDFNYKNFTLDLNFAFIGSRNIINQSAANRFDFANRLGSNDMSSINEITFWKKDINTSSYPVYNPWSAVQAYRVDQDIFVENGAFFKLRSISLGYDLAKAKFFARQKNNFRRFYVYATAMNLFTITPYSGHDPELVNYVGVDNGYGFSIPKTFTLGLKLDL